MKAKLVSYSSKGLSKTESSKLSKGLMGYKDKSNKSQYTYERNGILGKENKIIVSKSTFIISNDKFREITDYISSRGGSVLFWDIDIPKKYFKN